MQSSSTKIDICTIVRFQFPQGKKPPEMGTELQKVFGESAPPKPTVSKWYKLFLKGKTSVEDNGRSERPSRATAKDKVEEVRQLLSRDRRQTCEELAEDASVSISSVYTILTKHLHKQKFSKWVLLLLTDDQKHHAEDQGCNSASLPPAPRVCHVLSWKELWLVMRLGSAAGIQNSSPSLLNGGHRIRRTLRKSNASRAQWKWCTLCFLMLWVSWWTGLFHRVPRLLETTTGSSCSRNCAQQFARSVHDCSEAVLCSCMTMHLHTARSQWLIFWMSGAGKYCSIRLNHQIYHRATSSYSCKWKICLRGLLKTLLGLARVCEGRGQTWCSWWYQWSAPPMAEVQGNWGWLCGVDIVCTYMWTCFHFMQYCSNKILTDQNELFECTSCSYLNILYTIY